MSYRFTDALKTGNKIIDEEHRYLLDLVNEIIVGFENGMNTEQVLHAIKSLAYYVTTHFAHEDDIMAEYHYPQMRLHSLWHKSYKIDIELTCNRVITEGVSEVTVSELKRRIETLIKHILTDDTKMAQYIQSNLK